jgi:hypothetical protein
LRAYCGHAIHIRPGANEAPPGRPGATRCCVLKSRFESDISGNTFSDQMRWLSGAFLRSDMKTIVMANLRDGTPLAFCCAANVLNQRVIVTNVLHCKNDEIFIHATSC